MSLRPRAPLALLASLALASLPASQAAPRPQPTFVRGVALDRARTHKASLLLRDGVIAAILDEGAPAPVGTREIDGTGLLCLPAFLDAFARTGLAEPQPVVDRDLPPDLKADVGIDMREANRKGIRPAFHADEALAIPKEQSEAWQKSGFGAALLAPGGQLLSGESVLASTRVAAMRDLVVSPSVFAHAAFAAQGEGYPTTLMGYFAQLRQFLLDSAHQTVLERRRAEGRPGLRPPHDMDLEAGAALLAGEKLVCEASDSDDVERWWRLGDEFGLHPDFAGGLEAWRVADLLAARHATVVLTLDWGKEVVDPRPKEAAAKPEESPEAPQSENVAEAAEKTADLKEEKAKEPVWEYQEPYRVRLERRVKWEQNRDCALELARAGVPFVFGTASQKPGDLLAHVRTLVKSGLPAEQALAALTEDAAHFLGVERRLGRIEPGFDATLALWRTDPLTDEKASVAWIVLDGFPTEFKEEARKAPTGGGPAEGVDASGTWTLDFVVEGEGMKSATLTVTMEKDGSVKGTLEVENPMGGNRVQSDVTGEVAGSTLTVSCTLAFGEFSIDTKLEGELSGDALDGKGSFKGPWSEEPSSQKFTGKRQPK